MSYWMHLSVRAKLIGAFGLLILMILAVSAAALQSIREDGEQFADYVEGVEARAAMANQVRLAVDRRAIAARNLVLVTRPEDVAVEKAAVAAAVEDVRQSLDALQALSDKPGAPAEARRRVEEIARIESQYSRVAEAIVGLVLVNDREAAVARMNDRCRPLLAALVKATDDYLRDTAATSERLVAGTARAHARRMAGLAAGCALIVLLAVAAAVAITREIRGLISDSAAPVEAGAAQVGEAGIAAQEGVASIARVTAIMGEIRTASAEQSEGVGQVGGAVSSMDRATQQTAALVEEMAAAASGLKGRALDLGRAVGMFRLAR